MNKIVVIFMGFFVICLIYVTAYPQEPNPSYVGRNLGKTRNHDREVPLQNEKKSDDKTIADQQEEKNKEEESDVYRYFQPGHPLGFFSPY